MSKIRDLLLNDGLYKEVSIDISDLSELTSFLVKNINSVTNIDSYCTTCHDGSVFHLAKTNTWDSRAVYAAQPHGFCRPVTSSSERQQTFDSLLNQSYSIDFRCTRNNSHFILFALLVTNNSIQKIGQFPSIADLLLDSQKQYRTILKNHIIEYNMAIKLHAHGIGIGAFVYLRRIFENLIISAFRENENNFKISLAEFVRKRMEDKLQLVQTLLPESLTAHLDYYKIISKGIHELAEDECLAFFPVALSMIQIILDDILEKTNKEKHRQSIESAIAKMHSDLSKTTLID
jgi:hypothetical protein